MLKNEAARTCETKLKENIVAGVRMKENNITVQFNFIN